MKEAVGEHAEPPPYRPPVPPTPPLQRPRIPEADWEAEQEEREELAARERAHAKLLRQLAEEEQ